MNETTTSIEKALIHKINQKTKPVGSLGMLEKIALQIGTIQNTLTPALIKPCMFVFAADHGITEEKVSPYPKEVTYQMVFNFLKRGAAINVFCEQNDIILKVVDAGVDYNFGKYDDLIDAKIKNGTNNYLLKPAMTCEEGNLAIKKGRELIIKQTQIGTNTFGFGEMGIGNTSSAALLMHKYCKFPINECVGRGTGLNDEGLAHKLNILTQVSEKYEFLSDPRDILFTLGGLEIAMMAGAMLEAYSQNCMVLIDGFIATSALLAAHSMVPGIIRNCIFCHQSDEYGHKKMLDYLKAEPVLKLDLRLGEGTGVAIAYPIIKSAVNFLNNMASFDEAKVHKKADR